MPQGVNALRNIVIAGGLALVLAACGEKKPEAPAATPAVVAPPVAAPPVAAPAASAAVPDFSGVVAATGPIAYFRLLTPAGKSEVGGSTYGPVGGVTSAKPGPVNGAGDFFANFNGQDAYIITTQTGGITTAASIMAWVSLNKLPGDSHRIVYVAGESQSGNDLDIQFEADNSIRFYTSGGSAVSFAPPVASLVNQWHMVLVTLDTEAKTRAIYWDGAPGAIDQGGGTPNKTALFSIGESTVFRGRYFTGGIAEVALWNRVVTPVEAANIFAAARLGSAPAAAAPAVPAAPASATSAAAPAAPPAAGDAGPLATNAKVEVEDASGKISLKREEQIAVMFMTAFQFIESDCVVRAGHACPMAELLAGPTAKDGTRLNHLKFDPALDPNYSYVLGVSGAAWEAHANPKSPGLGGFYWVSKNMGIADAYYNPAGPAGVLDKPLTSRGIVGDSFFTH